MAEALYEQGTLIRWQVEGRAAFLLAPTGRADTQRRWLWYTSCWHAVPRAAVVTDGGAAGGDPIAGRYYVAAALASGFHVAGMDVGVTCGSPAGTALCHRFYQRTMGEHRLNRRARLVAQSNGALIMYNWAASHPDCVDRIMGIFPAVDLRAWPGLVQLCRGEPITDPRLGFELSLPELEARLNEFNPIDRLEPLAAAGVKLFCVHGDRDETVPFELNSGKLHARYEAMGGKIEVERIEGAGHTGGPRFYESQRALTFLLG